MFNLPLALITGLIIGWNAHALFMQLNTPTFLPKKFNSIQEESKELTTQPTTQIVKEIKDLKPYNSNDAKIELKKEHNLTSSKPLLNENFYTLLDNNLFSSAMSHYVDASPTKISLYRVALLKYFDNKIKIDPQRAIEEMLEFQELEPPQTKVNLEDLHEVEEGNDEEKAAILLKLIKEKIEKKPEYQYRIPLEKVGEHFILEVEVNRQPITLLLDTGATLTMINENILNSSLHTLKEHIVLNTAGGEIHAKLQEANTFTVGEIELENFQIVSSKFKQKKADGLLGMNFLKKFKFKIDQEKSILYLSPKEEEE